MQVQVHGLPLPACRSRKPLWALALLTLHPNRPVQREWLAETLWPDSKQSQAFANLRPVLSELRRALAEESKRLQAPNRHTLLLDLTDAEVDLLRFEAAIARGTFSDLEQAVALYRGPLLEGCHEEWALPEREAREQGYLQALQKLGDAALVGGNYDAATDYYQRVVRIDPWQEAARRGWMEALAKKGDTHAALQVYREFVAFLKDDPKAVPDELTRGLYRRLRAEMRLRAGTPVAVTEATAPVPSVNGYLSHSLTDLVGREEERQEVARQLRHSRLVTLTGMGGIGKTRLAWEVANEVVQEYADGVWLVALESLTEGRLVIQQIASVLGLREERGRTPLQSVTEHLCHKRLLLVLDNCEHLMEASAEAVAHLLRECAEVRILATSREALGIADETVWSVPALAVPDMEHLPEGQATLLRVLMGYESVQLFVERAEAVQKGFALTGSNVRMVAQVCQKLEGVPLAIELAAARVRVMTVEQIVSRLDNHLGLLTGGSRLAQSRQQTLRATLDWSYHLLSQQERSLLCRLSVFAGGCTREAVAGSRYPVIGESRGPDSPLPSDYRLLTTDHSLLDLLSSLVDKSLVRFEQRESEDGRYRLLEMVRQYAAERLHASGEAEAIKNRHRDWFLALAEEAEPQLNGADQASWLRRLETEHDNLRVALAWSATEGQEAQAGLRLAGALNRFWHIRGDFHEARASLERALSQEGARAETVARAKALNGLGTTAYRQGEYASARALAEEALTIQRALGDKAGMAVSLNNLGNVLDAQGEYGTARSYYAESLTLNREIGDRALEAINLTNLGNVAQQTRDSAAARSYYEESLAIRRELGDRLGVAYSVTGLGFLSQDQGDYVAAQSCYKESLAIRRELGDRRGAAVALGYLGQVAQHQGDFTAARSYYEESLHTLREIGERRGMAGVLNDLGTVAQDQGDYAAAQSYCEESLALNRDLGNRPWEAISLHTLGNIARDRGDYAAARTLLQEGKNLFQELGDTRGIATSLNSLGDVENARGEHTAACASYAESLRLFQRLAHRLGLVASLEGMAAVMLERTEVQKAARLWGASHELREGIGTTMPLNRQAQYNRQRNQARSALGEEAFAVAWEEGRAMTMEQAVHVALGEEAEGAIY
jgi:predicted ATPase/DNA-binding SARP family transcriptional activator